MSSIGKSIAQIGASFIPGIGPIASNLIGGVGGAALGGLGGSGKQGSQNFTQNSSTTQNSTQNLNQFNEAVEDPEFSQFRKNLLPLFQQEFRKGQQPVYGEAQKAQFLTQLNDLAGASMESLKGSLAGAGVLNSGRLASGATDIEMGRAGKAADFFSQLPFLEEERRGQNASNLLGLGMNFAGRAPISQRVTGTNSTEGISKTTGAGTQEYIGPGFLKGFAGNLAGMAGDYFGGLSSKKNNFGGGRYLNEGG